MCCGRKLLPLKAKESDEAHKINIEKIEDDFYITFSHPMTKEHYISFISYVRCDKVFTVKLYPEQSGELRFPQMYGGKMYYYCNKHGLFEYLSKLRRKNWLIKEIIPKGALLYIFLQNVYVRSYANEKSKILNKGFTLALRCSYPIFYWNWIFQSIPLFHLKQRDFCIQKQKRRFYE